MLLVPAAFRQAVFSGVFVVMLQVVLKDPALPGLTCVPISHLAWPSKASQLAPPV